MAIVQNINFHIVYDNLLRNIYIINKYSSLGYQQNSFDLFFSLL